MKKKLMKWRNVRHEGYRLVHGTLWKMQIMASTTWRICELSFIRIMLVFPCDFVLIELRVMHYWKVISPLQFRIAYCQACLLKPLIEHRHFVILRRRLQRRLPWLESGTTLHETSYVSNNGWRSTCIQLCIYFQQ